MVFLRQYTVLKFATSRLENFNLKMLTVVVDQILECTDGIKKKGLPGLYISDKNLNEYHWLGDY